MASGARLDAVYPLTPMQEGMLFHSLLHDQGGAYLVQWSVDLVGELDAPRLRRAWQAVTDRHPALRTTFPWDRRERPLQAVVSRVDVPWTTVDWSDIDEPALRARFDEWLAADRLRPFALKRAPLFRLVLFRLSGRRHRLVWSSHHLLLDGWSTAIVLAEVTAEYAAASQGAPAQVVARRPFRDFVSWLDTRDARASDTFWQETLRGYPGPTRIGPGAAWSNADPTRQDATRRRLERTLDRATTSAVRVLAAQGRVTEHVVVLGAFLIAAARLSGRDQVSTGLTVSGRPPDLDGADDMVGLFINTLPLGARVVPSTRLDDWLADLQRTTSGSSAHAWTALPALRGAAGVAATQPLFEHVFVFENYPDPGPDAAALAGLRIEHIEAIEDPDLPLAFVAAPGGELRLRALIDPMRFTADTAERLLDAVADTLRAMVARPDATLRELRPDAGARETLAWQGARPPLPAGGLWSQTAAIAIAMPDAIAVEDGAVSLTYAALTSDAERLAAALVARGVTPGDRVGILAERSPAFLVGMLATLRCGAAYVPLDPSYPPERLRWMARDAALRIVCAAPGALAIDGIQTIALPGPQQQDEAPGDRDAGHGTGVDGDWPAYVMYTSGSTGEPKGAVIPQRAVTRLVHGDSFVRLGRGARVAFSSSVSFDASTLEIWGALVRGGTLVLVPRETLLDPAALGAWLPDARIDLLWLTAGVFHAVARDAPQALASVGCVIAGGDALEPGAIAAVLGEGPPGRLLNGYGPTENTTFTTTADLGALEWSGAASGVAAPIGAAIGHTEVYVLDAELQPAPPGVVGDLYTGGLGLADGYWRRPDLTADRFVPHPFGATPGARLYRTGDRARWIAPGRLAFEGRADAQVKIRGFRVEPGEVEAALARLPGIRRAVVTAHAGPGGEKQLVGFVEETAAGAAALARDRLARLLPAWLVPAALVVVTEWPLNANGKVDRGRLPAVALDEPVGGEAAERGLDDRPVAAVVAGIWADVLQRPAVAPDANFFELGGHSLLATVVISRVRTAFGIELPLQTLFDAPALDAFCAAVAAARGGAAIAAPSLVSRAHERAQRALDHLPLSFAQQRLWFLDRFAPLSAAYHIPHALRLHGVLDEEALRRALSGLVTRHEALRTLFVEVDGRPFQVVQPAATLDLPTTDLSALAPDDREAELLQRVTTQFETPFDLSRGPLVRAALFRLGASDHVLSLTLHHIVADGWSAGIVARELGELYRAALARETPRLPALPLQYPDFAAWQREYLSGDVLDRQVAHWRAALAHAPVVELPADHPRPPTQSFRGATLPVTLTPELSAAVAGFARRHDVTVFMVLHAAFLTLLHRTTGQRDLVVGTPVANRNRTEIEGLVGFFVNLLALRVTLDPTSGFADLVARVRRAALDAYDHQDVPFEMLVDALAPRRDPSRQPIVQMTLAVHNVPDDELTLPGLTIDSVRSDLDWVRFDAELHFWQRDGSLQGYWAYARDLFESETIARLHRGYVALLTAAVADPRRALSRLPLVDGTERRRLVHEWNDTDVARTPALVHQVVERRAAEAPDALAVVLEDGGLTRGELGVRANRLAHHLRGLGVGPDVRVGVLIDRSIELAVAILGIVRAGGVYVALDPAWPPTRLARFIDESGTVLVCTHGELATRLVPDLPVVALDACAALLATLPATAPDVALDPDHGVYVIGTSGSTGPPKAVLVTHGALANHMAWMMRVYPLDAHDRVLQKTTMTFDAAVWEIWAPLMQGAPLVLARPGLHADPRYLVAAIVEHRITTLQLVPSMLRLLVDTPGLETCTSLERLFVGGEALTWDLVNRLRARLDVRVINLYGPAEATIEAVTAEWPRVEDGPAVIGRPIDNMRALVLDEAFEPVPIGVPGELYLAGDGLARGYLGQPGLTAERFGPNPLATTPGERAYRTGDLVRWLANGRLEYRGRRDHQVKVRGQRVELGEIEAELHALDAVAAAVVTLQPPANTTDGAAEPGAGGATTDPRLVAYVVPAREATHDAGAAAARVEEWRTLYDSLYDTAETADPTFDTTGWTSSYTGAPIPREEMRAWRDATVARIGALEPRRIVEIGCGTGMLLFALAPSVERYEALDVSQRVLQRVDALARARSLDHVTLACGAAHDVSRLLPAGAADVVVLNSVIQYFPSAEYLLEVLARAVDLAADGAAIFIGDVRSLPLLEAYHASVELARAADEERLADLGRRVASLQRREEELVVDPMFFEGLSALLPRVAGVAIAIKPFAADNELARYRYDVVLSLDRARRPRVDPALIESAPTSSIVTLDGRREDVGPATLAHRLTRERPSSLRVEAAPNARLSRDWELLSDIRSGEIRSGEIRSGEIRSGASGRTVGDVRRERAARADAHPDPAEYWRVGESAGYDVDVTWARRGGAGELDVTFVRRGEHRAPARPASPIDTRPTATSLESLAGSRDTVLSLARFTNDPMAGRWNRTLVPRLRRALESRLPAALVPQAIVCLDRLPRTSGGKVDRQALPAPDRDGLVSPAAFARPVTPTEQAVAGVWRRVLDVERVGVDDNFFALGGHSLLVVALSAALARDLGVEIAVPDLFRETTIAAQARTIDARARAAATAHDVEAPVSNTVGSNTIGMALDPVTAASQSIASRRLVFAFPPLLGFGLAFIGLARRLPDVRLWAFDFPETAPDPIGAYVDEIDRQQPEGDLTLLAYSAGGPVAFDVTRQLEARGRKVATLICLDAVLIDRRPPLDPAGLEAVVRENVDYFERVMVAEATVRAAFEGSDLRARLASRMRAYLRFLDTLAPQGRIRADIHLVQAADVSSGDGRLDWRDWTTGTVRTHQGSGRHIDMVLDDHVVTNAVIVSAIVGTPRQRAMPTRR